MAPPHPEAFIREEILDELGLTVSEAATVLEVRRATLSDFANGNAAFSAEMALREGLCEDGNTFEHASITDAHTMRRRGGEIGVNPYRPPAPDPR